MSLLAADLRALHVPGQPVVLPTPGTPRRPVRSRRRGSRPWLLPAPQSPRSSATPITTGCRLRRCSPRWPESSARSTYRSAPILNTATESRRRAGRPHRGDRCGRLQPGRHRSVHRQLVEVEQHANYLAAIREAAAVLVVNARTDVAVPADAGRDPIDEVINRCRRYHQAGADCVFPIFADHTVIGEIVQAVEAPEGLSRPGWPSLADLASRGRRPDQLRTWAILRVAGAARPDARQIRASADPYDS